jgi:hypothetical protein
VLLGGPADPLAYNWRAAADGTLVALAAAVAVPGPNPLADLRELAHGISTATLAVEGLAGAVRSAAEHAQGAVTIIELPAERLPEHVERAVYRFIADSLRQTARTPAPDLSVAVRRAGRDVIIELTYNTMTGQDWPAADLADRIAAAGGHLQRAGNHGHQQLIVCLLCE